MSDAFVDTVVEQFPTTVLWRQCRDVVPLNNALAALIRGLRDSEPNAAPGTSTRGGYQTDTNFLYRDDAAVRALQQLIYQGVQAYLPRYFQSNVLTAPTSVESRLWGWAVIMRPGDYNMPHVHPDAHVSGVYYVEVPELSPAEADEEQPGGSLVFHDPRSHATMYHLKDRRHTHSYLPAAGALVAFPSYHMHAVYPYRGPGERISVAFNARLTLK
jgi:uncharacterized protein (TIGR02466 family)